MSDSAFGSLRIVPKHPAHVHGDGNDGTTTRWAKACAMSDKIDLPLSRVSMRRHHAARTRVLVLCIGCGVLLSLSLWALWRSGPKIMGWIA